MTQVTVGGRKPEHAALPDAIPQPRRAEPVGVAQLEHVATPVDEPQTPVAAAPARIDTPPPIAASRRGRGSWRAGAFCVDAGLALTLSTAAMTAGMVSWRIAAAVAITWPLLLLVAGHYRRRTIGESHTRRVRVIVGTGLRGSVLVLAGSPWITSVGLVDLAKLVAVVGVASGLHHLATGRRHRLRLVVAGRRSEVREALLEFQAVGSHDVVAVCLTRASKTPFGDVASYVGVDNAATVADDHDADAVVLLPGAGLTPAEVRRLHWALTAVGTELCLGTGLLDVTPTRTRVFATGGMTLVGAAGPSLDGPRRWVKDGVERMLALAGLVILAPAMLTIALLVRLDSPGPAVYRQQRVGRHGRPFTMYKFRSMTAAADLERSELVAINEADGVLFKVRCDPRVTRLGRWLRRNSLDELPQLVNVVRGDMSLVGPRPALPEEVAQYDCDPRRRLVVKPGITGLWQVSGRSDLTWAESVRLDVKYVENWSLGLDVSILARTVRAVLGHRGAY